MKVYACPDEVPAPEFDWDAKPGDPTHWQTAEAAHQQQLVDWLKRNGYSGKNTGGIAQFGVADGYAQYMLAEPTPGNGGQSILIHLPYGDAWQYQHIEHLPKAEILKNIEHGKKMVSMFAKKEDA